VRVNILKKAMQFALHFTGPDGSVPRIGDWDEGFVFSPCLDFLLKAGKMLSFGKSILDFNCEKSKYGKVAFFPESQIASFRRRNGDLIVFRSAKVEHGHSHLDMLSIHYMGSNGPVIMDAGTFQYNYSKEKRNEYRGVNAHSTIVAIDNFQPLKPFRAFGWNGKLDADIVSGERFIQGAYQLKKDIKLQRTIQIFNDGFSVRDKCHGPYNFYSQFIVPEARTDGKKVLVFDSKGLLKLSITPRDDVEPMIKMKLVSDCYGQEKKVNVILYHLNKDNVLKICCLN
jgi:hypothetical protein